jgi:hypothetical protein
VGDFIGEDLSASRLERINLAGSRFERVDLFDAQLHAVDLTAPASAVSP